MPVESEGLKKNESNVLDKLGDGHAHFKDIIILP